MVILSFQSEFRKDKTATWLHLPHVVLLSPPTFLEARDEPEPGSFFLRSPWDLEAKDPGNEVDHFRCFLCLKFSGKDNLTCA